MSEQAVETTAQRTLILGISITAVIPRQAGHLVFVELQVTPRSLNFRWCQVRPSDWEEA